MYSLNWHHSFDVCKLVDAVGAMLTVFNISLIGRVDTCRCASKRLVWTGFKVLHSSDQAAVNYVSM